MTKKEAKIIVISAFSNSGLIIEDYIFSGSYYSEKECDKINQAMDDFTNELRRRVNKLKSTNDK